MTLLVANLGQSRDRMSKSKAQSPESHQIEEPRGRNNFSLKISDSQKSVSERNQTLEKSV